MSESESDALPLGYGAINNIIIALDKDENNIFLLILDLFNSL